MTRLEDDNR
jgi:hypothetical protein